MSLSLPYPSEVSYKDIVFQFDKELGAGAFGKVYKYKSVKNEKNVIAVKIEEESKKQFGSSLDKESLFLRDLDKKGITCVPKYYENGLYQGTKFIMI